MIKYSMICSVCSRVFSSKRKHASTCSSTCRSAKYMTFHRKVTTSKTCKVCAKEFDICGKNYSKVFCSIVCRNKERYYREFNTNERVKKNLRSRLYDAVKGKIKKGSAIKDLGCSIEGLKKHLESKFSPGMSWDNYGKEWHIDHIKPLSLFNLEDIDEFKEAVEYNNLQPLWVKDNLKKGNKYE